MDKYGDRIIWALQMWTGPSRDLGIMFCSVTRAPEVTSAMPDAEETNEPQLGGKGFAQEQGGDHKRHRSCLFCITRAFWWNHLYKYIRHRFAVGHHRISLVLMIPDVNRSRTSAYFL